jgi:predicted transcriptional regulator
VNKLSTQINEFDFFTIRSLMDNLPPLVTIDANAPTRDAVAKMCTKDYSQLPVVEDNNCVGSVTLGSILRQLRKEDKKGNLGLGFMKWPVKRFVDKNPRFVSPDDGLLKHIEWMADKGFILVGSPSKLEAIITNYDMVCFFKHTTEPFLLLREIETALRYIVRQKLQSQELKKALASVKNEKGLTPSSLDELAFNDLRQLILANWTKLQDIFLDHNKTDKQLQEIRNLRNEIFHFRARLSASKLDQLKALRDNYVKLARSLAEK